MPDVIIYMREGRSLDQKRNLVKSVTDAVVSSVGVSPEAVEVIIVEAPLDNFARGGVLLSERKSVSK